jgi:hypothetical protein
MPPMPPMLLQMQPLRLLLLLMKTQAEVMGDCEQRKKSAQLKSLNPKQKLMEMIIDRKGVFGVAANTKVSVTPPSTVIGGRRFNKYRRYIY